MSGRMWWTAWATAIAVAQAVHHIRPETKIQPAYSTNTGVPGAVAGQP